MPAALVALGFSAATAATIITVAKIVLVVASVLHTIHQKRKLKNSLRSLGDAAAEAKGRTLMVRESAAPRRSIYGECRVGGTIILMHVNGANNGILHLVIIVAGHEVTSFSQLGFDDESVEIAGTGLAVGKYAGYVEARYIYGTTGQTAQADLLANCPEIWTSAHRLRGSAGLYLKMKYNADLFPGGIPNITSVVKGKKVYDPRTALTNWSDNAALCTLDYLTDTKLGMGFDYFQEIIEDKLIASANVCDEAVPLAATGTEKRYTINGTFENDSVPQEVIDNFAQAMAGRVIPIGGHWWILAGYWRAPTITFDENDLRDTIKVQTKISRRENCNRVKGIYVSPLNFWQPADYPPVVNSTYLTQDNNEENWRELPLLYTRTASACQRIAKIELEQTRQGISLIWPGKLSCYRVQCGDVVNITNTVLGWSAKPFEVIETEFKAYEQDGAPALGVDLILRETAAGVYDWDDGEETEVDLAPNTNLPNPFAIAPPTALAVLSDNTTRIEVLSGVFVTRIRATWTPPADDYVRSRGEIRLQYKLFGESDWIDVTPMPGDTDIYYIANPIESESYVIRIRSENRMGIVSPWLYSDPTTTTGDSTPPSAPTDFDVVGETGGMTLSWENPADADLDHIDIYEHTATTPAPTGGSTPTYQVSAPAESYFRGGVDPGDTKYFWIRAVDTSGNKSSWVGPVGATSAAALSAYITPDPLEETDDSGVSSAETLGSFTVNVTGGTPSYTYLWEIVATDIPILSITTPTAVTTTMTYGTVGMTTNPGYATVKCTVTDNGGSGSSVITSEVTFLLHIDATP